MDKVAKLILNSLKCPVCGGQIDYISYPMSRHYNYGCANDSKHYQLVFQVHDPPYRIKEERVTIYNGSYQYQIDQQHYNTYNMRQELTIILVKDVDLENRVIEGILPRFFKYNKCLFNFSQTNCEKLLNKVKTILVFQ